MNSGKILIAICVATVGFTLAYNTDLGSSAKAVPAIAEVPTVKFNPVNKFNLELDLETGKAVVESNVPITSTNVTVNNPTKLVEKVVYKPYKVIEYETKVEVREKWMMLSILPPKFHKPAPQYPKRVE